MFDFFKQLKVKRTARRAELLARARQQSDPSESDIQKEVSLHLALADLYDKYRFNKRFPMAERLALESLRNAASLGNASARYQVGERLLEQAKFWQAQKESIYGCNAHGNYAKAAYEEALVFLEAAEQQGHAKAKRLRGLCYINGWGVMEDKNAGFQLVVDSIEQEKAWDKATQIFEETGLNKPEFFSTMMSMRKNNS